MKEEWESAKEVLEQGFEYVYGIEVSLSEREVFEGLLYCFEDEIGSHSFPFAVDDDELEAMKERRRLAAP